MHKRWCLAAAIAIFLFTCPSRAAAMEPAELIAGLAARSQAIASGRLSYTFKTETFRGGRALNSMAYPETTTSFSDSSWAERVRGSHVVRINHDGYFLEFVQTPQADGSLRPGATLLPQKSLESRSELNAPPIFAGSFWFREQLKYAEKHASEFRVVGSGVANAIPVEVVELAVPAENYRDAFHVVVAALKSGGAIRLHVAPQLGFVLPRVEFLTTSNQVAQSYDASDFSEVAPGIYFPGRLRTETQTAGNGSRYVAEFTTRCELINESIPEEDFLVKLPVGTRVQDAQVPGNVVTFELSEASLSSTLAGHGPNAEPWVHGGLLGRWHNAVILGFVIGTVASISFLIAARNQRHRV